MFYSIDDNEELKGLVELYLRSNPSNDISFNMEPLEKAISQGYVTSRLKSNVSEPNNVNDISFNMTPLKKAISQGYVTSRSKSNVSESNKVNRIF